MFKILMIAAALAATTLAQAQAPAPTPAASAAPSSPAKKELVARVLKLQQPGIETMARTLAEQPALRLMQQAGAALQRLPAERREAVARDIEADLRKYSAEAVPIVRDQAIKLAPTTIGLLIEERFTEDELRQIVALLESPVNRKFQSLAPEMQRSLGEKLIADTRPAVEPKLRALEQTVAKRLGATPAAAASAPAPKK
ncbi:MAG: hypothetical protein Q7S90_08875 [Rubrivivax sp.]|nr:hypothetical protein [Rubrivivax sp.]